MKSIKFRYKIIYKLVFSIFVLFINNNINNMESNSRNSKNSNITNNNNDPTKYLLEVVQINYQDLSRKYPDSDIIKKTIKYLIKNKCKKFSQMLTTIVDINAQDREGRTILMVTCQYGTIELVESIIKMNPMLKLKDDNKKTALHYCIENKNDKDNNIFKLMYNMFVINLPTPSQALDAYKEKITGYTDYSGTDFNDSTGSSDSDINYKGSDNDFTTNFINTNNNASLEITISTNDSDIDFTDSTDSSDSDSDYKGSDNDSTTNFINTDNSTPLKITDYTDYLDIDFTDSTDSSDSDGDYIESDNDSTTNFINTDNSTPIKITISTDDSDTDFTDSTGSSDSDSDYIETKQNYNSNYVAFNNYYGKPKQKNISPNLDIQHRLLKKYPLQRAKIKGSYIYKCGYPDCNKKGNNLSNIRKHILTHRRKVLNKEEVKRKNR